MAEQEAGANETDARRLVDAAGLRRFANKCKKTTTPHEP
jgi:hypothetical protein